MNAFYKKAQPVWLSGFEREPNITAGFYSYVKSDGSPIKLVVATSGFYRVFLDGKFVQAGPARCARGYFRVDELSLVVAEGDHHIAIDVVNYYLNSFESLRQPGFVQIEVLNREKVLAASGVFGFVSYRLTERIRKMQRFSYQRPMGESYRIFCDINGWRVGNAGENAIPSPVTITELKSLLPRNLMPYTFPITRIDKCLFRGTSEFNVAPKKLLKDRSLTDIGNSEKGNIDGWEEKDLELHLSDEVQHISNTSINNVNELYSGSVELSAGQFEILSLQIEKTGYITLDIDCTQAGTFYIMVDETLRADGDVDPLSMESLNVIKLDVSIGKYEFRSAEPYGFRYIKFVCKTGCFCLKDPRITELVCPQPIIAHYTGQSDKLKAIFSAACETFIQNSVDIFMDCPTRERAGWLCDSFFTARTEYILTGDNVIERNFLENFRLAENFPYIPKGMLPMCYPADCLNGQYIPNWAMWFVLELEDFYYRNNDLEFIKPFKQLVVDLLDWFAMYENSDGLLEKLPGWIFVEWSRANLLVQDINFPTNMLYARTLTAAATLFDMPELEEKAHQLRQCICERSFNGNFFTDNEVYNNGVPVSSGESTETCQYYAFFTGVATPQTHPQLWKILCDNFGPKRLENKAWEEISPSNAFIGNYLRLELLAREKLWDQLLNECTDYFYYMAQKTGTLWENITDYASCNHGFASYVAVLILEAEKNKKQNVVQTLE